MARLFDWRRDCPDDVARRFPPIAGKGRGQLLKEQEALRKLRLPHASDVDPAPPREVGSAGNVST